MKERKNIYKEASDPSTPEDRLVGLISAWPTNKVRRLVAKNPSLPIDAWREKFFEGWPETWDSPLVLLELMDWSHGSPPDLYARMAAEKVAEEPSRIGSEGRQLLLAQLSEWWSNSHEADRMLMWLGKLAAASKKRDAQRALVSAAVGCIRPMLRDLAEKDRPVATKILDELEAWSVGGKSKAGWGRIAKLLLEERIHEHEQQGYPIHLRIPIKVADALMEAVRCSQNGYILQTHAGNLIEACRDHEQLLADMTDSTSSGLAPIAERIRSRVSSLEPLLLARLLTHRDLPHPPPSQSPYALVDVKRWG